MKHKITIETKGFSPFQTMRTEIITRKPSTLTKCIDAGTKHIPSYDRSRTDIKIAQMATPNDNVRSGFTRQWYNDIAQ